MPDAVCSTRCWNAETDPRSSRFLRLGVPFIDCAIERSCRTLEALVRLAERGIGRGAALCVSQGRDGGGVLGEEERQSCDDEERRHYPGCDDDGEVDDVGRTSVEQEHDRCDQKGEGE